MRAYWNSTVLRHEAAAMGGLLFLVAFVWCAAWGMWTPQDFTRPTAYLNPRESDVIGMYASFKAAAEGHYAPLLAKRIPQLGAPDVADWTSIPTIEELPIYLTGLLARAVGLFAALNIKLLLGHLLAALTFYAVARYMGCELTWAFLGGLAFGTAPFIFSESPHHSIVAYVWHIPLFLPIWQWVSSKPGIVLYSRRFWFAVAVAFVTGLQNVYYTNIFCQLTLLGGVILYFRERCLRSLLPVFAIIFSSAAAFGLMSLDTWLQKLGGQGIASAIQRPYKWLEIYALKPVDLIIPLPTHHFEAFRTFAINHANSSVLVNEGSYLGLLGIAALLWVFGAALYAAFKGRAGDIPREAWQILWVFAAFATGGLNTVAGAFGFTMFRAGYRMSVVILAIVLLFAMLRASQLSRLNRRLGSIIAIFLGLLVIWDQMPVPHLPAHRELVAMQVESDREFTKMIEARLPGNAMIFQIPIMSFPEAPVQGITPYEHFRPYLFSNRLRFSFGATKAEIENGWQSKLGGLGMEDSLQLIQKQGFQAVYINRKGFPDKGEEMIKAFQNLGVTERIDSQSGDLVCLVFPK
ncbi:MAG: hypothetical protein ACOYM3_22845 [Terrimicrobiaceae bacterium]